MIFCILAWTIFLSSCLSLQDGQKVLIYDVHGRTGIHEGWTTSVSRPCQFEGWYITLHLELLDAPLQKQVVLLSPLNIL